ncbi:MAG TPA: YegS/Rv2252/BmrU family lipid kinase, partial [Alphaproteobacteria bacterium]|nr:YegS/Rv2252/BmrU family lipid kinase [Alphaproteobacteria bacterium]
AFGLLPLGTANDLARSLGIPSDPAAAMTVVTAGHVRRIDVGLANDRYFVNAAHIGLAARVTRNLSGGAKRKWGTFAYVAAVVRMVRRHRPFRATLRCDGAAYHLRSAQITIGNGCHFGAGILISEDAALDDGLLDFYSLPPKGLLGLAALAPSIRLGRHVRYDDVRNGKGRVIEVQTRHPMGVTTDGELTTRTPLRCEVCPGRLAVFTPAPQPPS